MRNVKLSLILLLACVVLAAGILGACSQTPKKESSSSAPESSEPVESSEPEDRWEPEPEPEPEAPAVSVSEPSSSEESSVPEEPKTNPFTLDSKSITDMYIYNPSGMIYTRLDEQVGSAAAENRKSPIIDAINALPRLSGYDYDKSAKYSTGFLIYDSNGARHEYNIIPGALIVNGTGYYLPKENYEQIMSLAAQYTQDSGIAQWLLRISPARVTGIKCMDLDGGEFSVKQENLRNAAQKVRGLTVSGVRAFQKGHYELMGMDGFYMQITFDTGVTFTMLIDDKYLYLESSDMSFGCRYSIGGNAANSFPQTIKKLAA